MGIKKLATGIGKFAYNVKTAPIRFQANLVGKGARVVGATKLADFADGLGESLDASYDNSLITPSSHSILM